MSALIGNPLLLTSAPAGDDAYQIEKSLRFDSSDSAYLTRTPGSKGNRRTWTWSGWVKRSVLGSRKLFVAGPSGTEGGIQFHSGTGDTGIRVGDYNGSHQIQLDTSQLFRDASAWYHIVVVYDTTNSTEAERTKLYINGERVTSFSTATYPSQNYEGYVNNNIAHALGAISNPQGYFDGYLADVQFIDGLALSPAAFGSFDSTGNWNPKAFALPAPNADTTWSSGTKTNEHASYPVTNAFNGSIDNGWGAADAIWNNAGLATFTPSNKIECNQAIRIYASAAGHDPIDPYWYVTTANADGVETRTKYEATVQTSGGNTKWYDVFTGKGELKKIEISHGTPGALVMVRAIEIDGVILVDGKTDQTWDEWAASDTINTGVIRSGEVTSETGSFYGANVKENLFDGRSFNTGSSTSNVDASTSGKWVKWTPSTAVSFSSKVEVAVASNNNTISLKRVGVGSTDDITTSGSPAWHTVYTGSGQIEYLQNQPPSGGYNNWEAIRVDGVILLDWGHNTNSFHLKFNDASRNSALGKDTLNGKIADATGGLPIYNTTDDYGDVKGSGYRSDSNSANLILALPLDATASTSVEATIHGSGTNKSLTNGAINNYNSTSSRFYGNSSEWNATSNEGSGDQKVEVAAHADWAIGTGDLTVEAWLYKNSGHSGNDYLFDQSGNDFTTYWHSSNGVSFAGVSSSAVILATADIPISQWFHFACVRTSGTFKTYINGALKKSIAGNWDVGDSSKALFIGRKQAGYDASWDGRIQDFRIYKTAKYTANFTTPNRNDLTVTNLSVPNLSGHLITKTSGDQSLGDWHGNTYSLPLPPASGVNKKLMYCGRGDGVWTISPAISSSGNITCRCYSDGGSNGDNKLRFYDGSSWSSWIDMPAGSGFAWVNVSTGVSNIEKIEHDFHTSGDGATDPSIAGFFINGGTADSDWWQYDKYVRLEADDSTDTPTNYGTDTGVGGEVRGNFCNWNPHDTWYTNLSQGNTKITTPSHTASATAYGTSRGTIAVKTGKWYWEIDDYTQHGSTGTMLTGVISTDVKLPQTCADTGCISYGASDGNKRVNGTSTSYGDTYTTGDIIGVALDMDNGAIYFSKNGTWQASGVPTSGSSRTNAATTWTAGTESYTPGISDFQEGSGKYITASLNTGQRAFKYTAPSGFKCLCTQNLPDTFSGDELNNPSKFFDVVTYTGDGASTQTIHGLNFRPDLIWGKRRDTTLAHTVHDVIRTDDYALYPNDTSANDSVPGYLNAFLDNGFRVGAQDLNTDNGTFCTWNWDAGTAAITPSSSYDITPSAQWVNTTAGFSITKWTGNGEDDQTLPHGLGTAPDFVIIKNLTSTSASWMVKHSSLASSKVLYLNDTGQSFDGQYGEIADLDNNNTVTLDDTGNDARDVNANGNDFIMYAWTEIPGYSKFSDYTGWYADTGPFVWTGFRPRFILLKKHSGTGTWHLLDTERSPYNPPANILIANTNGAEDTSSTSLDILSNGFRLTYASEYRNSGDIAFAAWAEHPFKTARAR